MNKNAYTKYFWLVNTAGGKMLSVLVAIAMVFSLTTIAFAIDEAVEALAGATTQAASSDADEADADNDAAEAVEADTEDAEDTDEANGLQDAANAEDAEDTIVIADDEVIAIVPNDSITIPIMEDTVVAEGETVPEPIYSAPTIVLDDNTSPYTSIPLTETTYTVQGLQDGDELFVYAFDGSQTEVGSSPISVADYRIWRGDDNVTYLYEPAKVQEATITIEKAPLYVTTPSAEKNYDGDPLVYEGDWNVGDEAAIESLWGDDAVDFVVTGSQTDVGSSVNTYQITWLSGSPNNYEIIEDLGTLTVLPTDEAVYLIAPSASKFYDGTPLRAEGLEWSGLPEGYTVEAQVEGELTDTGIVVSTVDVSTARILDENGVDVTSRYNTIEAIDGELVVEHATLSVLTEGADKVDDGRPLTAGGALGGLVNGETATLVTTGVQEGVGNSINTYYIDWNGTANEANYIVVEELGVLNIDPAPAPEPAAAPTNGNNGGNDGGNNGGNAGAASVEAAPATTPTQAAIPSYVPIATAPSTTPVVASNADSSANTGINPVVEAVATGMQNLEQVATGEEPTELNAPNARTTTDEVTSTAAVAEDPEEELVEEEIEDNENPLGVFDEPVDCWVHWYTLLGLIATAVYGGVVMFFRRAYTYELESREANLLGTRVGLARPRVPARGGHAGKEA